MEYAEEYKPESFFAFLRKRFKGVREEIFEVYFLDSDKVVSGKQMLSTENDYSVKFSCEVFAKILTQRLPAGVVIVHNHPCGDANPSSMDDKTTDYCQVVCEAHNVLLCDHIICGKDGFFSYYLGNKLKKEGSGIFSKK